MGRTMAPGVINYEALVNGDSYCQIVPSRPAGVRDPFFGNVVSLLSGIGANNGNTFTDLAASPMTQTVTGAIVTATDTQGFGGSSIRCFSGNTPNFLALSSVAPVVGNTEAFTFEAWIRVNDTVGAGDGYLAGRCEFLSLYGAGSLLFSCNGQIQNAGNYTFAVPSGQQVTPANVGGSTGTDRLFIMYVREASGLTSLFVNGYYARDCGTQTGAIDTIYLGNRALAAGRTTGAFVQQERLTHGIARQVRGGASLNQLVFAPPTTTFPNQ